MAKITTRSLLRVVFLALAFGCAWVALVAADRAVVRGCALVSSDTSRIGSPQIRVLGRCDWHDVSPEGWTSVWKTGPTIATIGFGSVSFVLALLAVTPRQGTLLIYRVRRPA